MPEKVRSVRQRFPGAETREGAGVRLQRMFGANEVPLLDPFLLLDNFGSANPADYLAGFPWHPHRGIDTVTYMLRGTTAHEDSLGNKGEIRSGDVQWMSSGSGILHQEMPQRTEGKLSGFQLWLNVPHSRKMENPAYRGIVHDEIPAVRAGDGRIVRVIAGTFEGVEGPAKGLPVDPLYLDISLPDRASIDLPVRSGHTAFAQLIDGVASMSPPREAAAPKADAAPSDAGSEMARPGETILYESEGELLRVHAGEGGARFLLGAGRPLHEPVAWYGPIVMNSREEIQEAISDLRGGTFVRTRRVDTEDA